MYSSPAVASGRVYFGSHDKKVYCLNASTGTHLWSYTTDNDVESPAVAYGKVYVTSGSGKVYCLDAVTGEHAWNYTVGGNLHSEPSVVDGRVYFGSHYAYNNNVYCLNASTGTQIWNYTTGNSIYGAVAVAYGKVYVGSDDYSVYAFATPVWSTDSVGNPKATFDLTNNVYISGQGFTAGTSVTVYLIPDGAYALPTNAVAIASAMINSTGGFPATLVWSQPLTLGEYDIWVDVNQNGVFDEGDVWNSQSIGIYAFNVIPKFSPLLVVPLFLTSITLTAMIQRKRRENERNPSAIKYYLSLESGSRDRFKYRFKLSVL
ncbi:MAG: outer membrane protein assembly factor BamB family protein [Thermoproteota archaeon]